MLRCSSVLRQAQRTGESQSIESLLTRPLYVGMSVRYILQTALADVAHRSRITEFLQDVEAMDAKYGRFGMRERRGQVIAQVKKIMDTIQLRTIRGFMRALTFHPDIKPTLVHVENYTNFAGGMSEHDMSKYLNLAEALREKGTLRGVFARLLCRVWGETITDEYLHDISDALASASPEERAKLSPDILDAWAEVEMVTDYIIMLGTDGEDWRRAPDDRWYLEHWSQLDLSTKITQDSVIDKYTKPQTVSRRRGR